MREFRTGLTETLVPTHPGLVLAVSRLCPPPDEAQRTLKNSQKAMDPIDAFYFLRAFASLGLGGGI